MALNKGLQFTLAEQWYEMTSYQQEVVIARYQNSHVNRAYIERTLLRLDRPAGFERLCRLASYMGLRVSVEGYGQHIWPLVTACMQTAIAAKP